MLPTGMTSSINIHFLFFHPLVKQFLQLLRAELCPLVLPCKQSLTIRLVQRYRACDGDIETLDHSRHRYLKVRIGESRSFVRNAPMLVAEDKGNLRRQVE